MPLHTFKDNKKLVLSAVSNSESLRYASNRLKNDKQVVLKAIEHNFFAYEWASEQLKHDKEIILLTLKKDEKEKGNVGINSIYFNMPEEIKNEIGDNDPINYLESLILKEKIEKQLENVKTYTSKGKLKI